jgi:uncharacterized protein with FMN-binding domain
MSFGIPKQDYSIHDVDLSRIGDGVYIGNYTVVPPFGTFAAMKNIALDVSVSGHRIVAINLKNPASMKKDLDNLGERVIKAQSVMVDVLSGATWTSTAYLKAVETALTTK